jgi:hypothetical protein
VKKLATSVFQFEEMKDAMLKFCDPDSVVVTSKPKNHNKVETCFDEIYTQWDKLQKSKTLPKAVVDSLSFLKLPMVRPGETRTDVSTQRIAALERMVGNLIEQNKMIVGSLEDLKKKESAPMTYASRAAADTGAVAKTGGSSSFGSAQNGQDRGRHLNVNRLQTRTRSQTPKRPRLDDEQDQQHGGPHDPPGHQNVWEDPNRRKYRSAGAKVIRGTAGVATAAAVGGAGGVRQGWKSAPRELFVYHTHHSTTDEDIRDLIGETSKVEVLEIEKRSREGAYFGSFRVRVNMDEFDKALSPEHWPSGWSVREYFVAKKNPDSQQNQNQNQRTS